MKCVYWLLAADGRVLYVGITQNLHQRLRTHERTQPWWGEVASVAHTDDLEFYTAVDQEVVDIQELWPTYNKHAYPAHYRPDTEVVSTAESRAKLLADPAVAAAVLAEAEKAPPVKPEQADLIRRAFAADSAKAAS